LITAVENDPAASQKQQLCAAHDESYLEEVLVLV